MQVIFDHIGAVVVGGGILLIFAFIQMRGTQSSADATINHMVISEATLVGQYFQRDIENMRTEAQTEESIARGKFTGGSGYSCQLTKTGSVTTQITFPTLAAPDLVPTLTDPDDAAVVLVSYVLTDTGNSVPILQDGVETNKKLYRLDRMVDGNYTGGSGDYLTHFSVEFANKGAGIFSSASTACSPDLAQVRFEFKVASGGMEWSATDQRSTSQLNTSRLAKTIALANME